MFVPKKKVVELFLEFIGFYLPLEQACLATLGGEGLEAELWLTHNLPPKQVWMIEQKQRLSRRLIARYPFNNCSSLERFSKVTKSVKGHLYTIDGFHLDSCGTFERIKKAFSPTLPLIVASRGKCLAITVADQRRNTSLENFSEILLASQIAFGGKLSAKRLLDKLTAEYKALPPNGIGLYADHQKGAEREFAFIYHLFEMFKQTGALPLDRVERYLYHSKQVGRQAFRMRTYFLHFKEGRGGVRDNLGLWQEAPLQFVTEKGIILIQNHERKTEMNELRKLVEALGGIHLQQYQELVTRAESSDAELGRQVRALVHGTVTTATAEVPAVATVTPPRRLHRKKSGTKVVEKTVSTKAPEKQVLETLLMTLRACAESDKALKKAKVLATKTLGLPSAKSMGCTFARTHGGHRASFMGRLAKNNMLNEAMFVELAGIYAKIDKSSVTVAQLKAEAGIT